MVTAAAPTDAHRALALLCLTTVLWQAAWGLASYNHSAQLDAKGHYLLHWGWEGTRISFQVEVQTLGYVGLGLSPTGGMLSSDIVIGGVDKDGKPYLQDSYTDRTRAVQRDESQDYRLEYAKENSTHTVLAFSRELDTCDPHDKVITESTVRVIWAYHADDIGPEGAKYHGPNRGRKSLRLLNSDPDTTLLVPPELPYFNLTNNAVRLLDKDTTYWCQMFKLPTLHKKHHIVKVETLIQQGHEDLVHHILLYQCPRGMSVNGSVQDYGHECYHPNMPVEFLYCQTVMHGWAIGGEALTYPPHVGVPFGITTESEYVLMEIHYDNPSLQQGLTDSSGLRMYYTPHLRKYDGGILEAGVWCSMHHMVPPGMPAFQSEGHCTKECIEEALGNEKPDGIHVFAVLLHAHLAAEAIRTRHFRMGEEQKMLAYDNEYDFNFQEIQFLNEERTILPGDHIITDCQYNTKNRTMMTWGGLSTRDEMCLSYLIYYPRINLTRCQSVPGITEQLQFIGVKTIHKPIATWPFIIKSPQRYKNMTFIEAMNAFHWTKKKGMSFNERVHRMPINVRCSKGDTEEWSVEGMLVSPPDVKIYEQEAPVCRPSDAPRSRLSSSTLCHCPSVHLLFTLCMAVTVGMNLLHL